MAKSLDALFPSTDTLNDAAGTALPPSFISLLRFAVSKAGRRGMSSLTETSLGFLLGGPWKAAFARRAPSLTDTRYQQTPPELVPFGSLGVDGVHYGFIVRSPELAETDFPIGELSPMDSDPSLSLGPRSLRQSRTSHPNTSSRSMMNQCPRQIERLSSRSQSYLAFRPRPAGPSDAIHATVVHARYPTRSPEVTAFTRRSTASAFSRPIHPLMNPLPESTPQRWRTESPSRPN